jgi:hypothetical protein
MFKKSEICTAVIKLLLVVPADPSRSTERNNTLETVLYPAAVCWKCISEVKGVSVRVIFWELR